MVTVNDILTFAHTHKVFTRKELIAGLKGENQVGFPGTLSEQLGRLLKSGQLVRIKRGVYKFHDDVRKEFSVVCSDEMRQINLQIKKHFPFVDYCLWSAATLMPYMHHIPKLNLLFVDVERDSYPEIFIFLDNNCSKKVFAVPSLYEFNQYISNYDAIIIRPLISESPLQLVDGISTPTIEKILVDIVGDVEFSFLKGSEINYVYKTIFERHKVNKNKLLRYASRRGRKNEVNLLLKINQL